MDLHQEDQKFNPWDVNQLEDFLFYCCPECDDKSSTKAIFINHALVQHPKARDIIPAIEAKCDKDDDLSKELAASAEFLEEELSSHVEDPPADWIDSELSKKHSLDQDIGVNIQCYYCCLLMETDKIEHHMRSEHGRYSVMMFGPQRPYQCQNCKCALAKDPSQDMHICKPYFFKRRSKGEKSDPIKCKVCSREFERQATLFNHMATAHSEERNFACSYCDFKAKISVVLKRHIKRKHHNELNFVCEICGKKFFEAYRLRLHEESHSKERKKRLGILPPTEQLPCEICLRSFLGKQALNVHKSVSHGISEAFTEDESKKSFTCDKCGKCFSTTKCLADHCNQEHPSAEKIASIECKCHSCNMNFDNAAMLNAHLTACSSTTPSNLKHFSCDKCSEGARELWFSAIALRKHIAESHGLVLTICDICGCSLKSKYYLEDHKKSVHEGLKNYACDYCGKVFASKSTLNGHVGRMHETIARKFRCDKCDFSCLEPNKLKIHEDAVHVKAIRFECQQCKYFSFRKTGLQNHIRVVHEKYRPYKCDICDLSFTYKRDKIKHLTKHPELLTLGK